MRTHKHLDQWNKLDTAISDAIGIPRGAQTARVVSKKDSSPDRDYKFFPNPDSDYSLPRGITTINNKFALTKPKLDLEITAKTLADDSKMTLSSLTSRKIGTFHFLDDETEHNSPIRRLDKSTKEPSSVKSTSSIKKKVFTKGESQGFIITSRPQKKFGVSSGEINSASSLHSIGSIKSANQLEKAQKSSEPICGIDDMQLRLLFRKKCEDMEINPYLETEDKFINNVKKKSTNNKLSLFESFFAKKALEHLATLIEGNPEVAQLILKKSCISEEKLIEPFSKSLLLMPNLVHLDLSNNALSSQDFSILFGTLSTSKTLVSIDISNCEPSKKNKLGAEGVEAFKQYAKGNIFLQFVVFTGLMLDDDSVQNILKGLEESPNLQAINLSSNVFNGRCLEELDKVFTKTTLTKIDLSHNKLKKEAAGFLAKCMQLPAVIGDDREGLEFILEDANLGNDANVIFEALGRATNLAKLNFSQNYLAELEMVYFDLALASNKTIQELNLSDCRLGEAGARLLIHGLKRNESLQSILLKNNNLGDKIGAAIMHAVMENEQLRVLDMAQNKLGAECAVALQELIKNNKSIQKYNMSMNNFDEQDGYLLQEGLFFNSRITQFNITYTRVKYTTLEAIDAIIKENQAKLRTAAVPKLQLEVRKKRIFVTEELHNIERVTKMNKEKEKANRDVKRFQETLTDLQSREKDPSIKKNERLLLQLSKKVKSEIPALQDINYQIREFETAAELEKESYRKMIQESNDEQAKLTKQMEIMQGEMDKISAKYQPSVKVLRFEMQKLLDEMQFLEMYNNTLADKIRLEKQVVSIKNSAPTTKISDVFLASSELARNKRKAEALEKEKALAALAKTHQAEQQDQDQEKAEEKVQKELEYYNKNRQTRVDKLIQEARLRDEKLQRRSTRKHSSRTGDSKQEMMRDKVNAKIESLFGPEPKLKMKTIKEKVKG